MKRLSSMLTFVVLAVFCFASISSAGEQVPFKGHFDPVITSITPVSATVIRYDVDVFVQATIIGKARGPAVFFLDLTTFTYYGEAVWVTSNGDAIFQSFAGQFVPTDTPGLFDNVETFTVTGGTGRFAGATGAGVDGGQFDAITNSATAPFPFEGTISSPGSLKR